MPWWEAVLNSLAGIAVLAVAWLVALFARRRWLSRRGGTFECSVRMHPPTKSSGPQLARGWTLGLARYSGQRLEWFRVFSFLPRPTHVFDRPLTVRGHRTPHGAEAFSLHADHVVVTVDIEAQRRIEMAMTRSALTGFLAWAEAAPPGSDRLPS